MFEGFVSYKDRTVKTDHRADVIQLLLEIVEIRAQRKIAPAPVPEPKPRRTRI
ncbi:MAG: hypothetical protein ABSG18_25360 [Steroidobacteraceae bacterium]